MFYRSVARRAVLFAIVLVVLCARKGTAQVIHLPPRSGQVLPPGTVLLSLRLKKPGTSNGEHVASQPPTAEGAHAAGPNGDDSKTTDSAAEESGTVSPADSSWVEIQDGQLAISLGGQAPEFIPLGNHSLHDIVADIRSRYGDSIWISSAYELLPASLLASTVGGKKLSGDTPSVLVAGSNEPEVQLGFGFILAMLDNADKQQQGLLSQAGFQLDVVGFHDLLGPGRATPDKRPGWRPRLFVQARLGLNANQQLNVQTDSGQGQSDQPADQFETALEQADQVAVTSQVDVVLPLWDGHTDFIITPLYGVNWTRLDPFTPPAALTSAVQADPQGIASDKLNKAVTDLDRTLPLSEFGLTGLFQFRRDGAPLFFFGGGFSWKEDIRRTLTYDTIPSGTPDLTTIRSNLSTPMVKYWTAQFGTRVAGVVDVRLDAAGPLGKRNGQPLLRVILGRSFPIVHE